MSHTNSTQNCVQIFFIRLPNLYTILYTFLPLTPAYTLGILRWMPRCDNLPWTILASLNLQFKGGALAHPRLITYWKYRRNGQFAMCEDYGLCRAINLNLTSNIFKFGETNPSGSLRH